jgi:hypothetical protein
MSTPSSEGDSAVIFRHTVPTLALAATMCVSALTAQTTPKKAPPAAPASNRPVTTTPNAAAPTAEPPKAAATPPEPRVAESPHVIRGERTRFGVLAAVAAPMSSLGQGFSAGYKGGLMAEGRPAGFPVSLRGDLQYVYFPGKNEIVTANYSVVQLTGAASYAFKTASGSVSPFFATGGIGLYRQSTSGRSQTDFGTNLGLGFNFAAAKRRTFTEARFHFFNDVEYFTLSLGFRL